ncbi:MAG: hypothetical protein G01um101425_795 [Candidatus Peregrinibacteria bacterium Gr01-1014_25]|nr:MAG: hypothetical protein G01um101425_795 [Candidatus Peregrinibacteria bacterium Gr01-1014_25]
MSETENALVAEYDAFLQSVSGLNRRIAESTPMGTAGQPRAIVEINGTGLRTFPEDVLKMRNLTRINIGKQAPGFNRTIEVEDMENADIAALLKDIPLGSVIIAHQEMHVSADWYREKLLDILSRFDDGRIYCIGVTGWNGKCEGIRDALKTAKEVLGAQIQITRDLIAPVLQNRLFQTLYKTSVGNQMRTIMDAAREKNGDARIEIFPGKFSAEHTLRCSPFTPRAGSVEYLGAGDDVITVRKLTENQRKAMRQAQRREKDKQRRK